MSLPSLSSTVTPRQDVLEGALVDAVFAANLDDVVRGQAPAVYGEPDRFFAQTFPSLGLRQMLEAVFGRLSGRRADEAPILRLETSLGGGKTHNLIALFHAARGGLPQTEAERFLDPALLLDEPPAIAVFVGTSTGATSFPTTAGVTPKTVWGHLALQLAGADGYEPVRAQDEALSAPGSDDLARVLDRSPRNLILIDELSRYLATAAAQAVVGSTLAKQTVSFLMALMEAVASRDDSCLVLTATGLTDVFGDETAEVVEALQNASDLISRRARTLRPSEESDLPQILAARLFERVDRAVAEEVAQAYADAAVQASISGLPRASVSTSITSSLGTGATPRASTTSDGRASSTGQRSPRRPTAPSEEARLRSTSLRLRPRRRSTRRSWTPCSRVTSSRQPRYAPTTSTRSSSTGASACASSSSKRSARPCRAMSTEGHATEGSEEFELGIDSDETLEAAGVSFAL